VELRRERRSGRRISMACIAETQNAKGRATRRGEP
jgi:hypothetical protein